MTKFILSSGTSVVCEVLDNEKITAVKVSNDASQAVKFNKIGDAVAMAIRVNKILGTSVYKATSVEVNKN